MTGVNCQDLVVLRTEGVHGSHDEEAPVGGHEAGGQGESGPWVHLHLGCSENVFTYQIAMPTVIRIFLE